MRDRLSTLLAHALPSRLAYWVAVRLLTHASLTWYRDVPTSEIRLLDALQCWYDAKIARLGTTPQVEREVEIEAVASNAPAAAVIVPEERPEASRLARAVR